MDFEYINSRKRLAVVQSLFIGDMWALQYKVKTKWFGYRWVNVATCHMGFHSSINKTIDSLENQRQDIKWYNKGYTLEF